MCRSESRAIIIILEYTHVCTIATLMRSFFMTIIYLMKMGGPYVRGSNEPPMAKTTCIVSVSIHE